MGPSTGLDWCGKSRPPPPGFDPRTVQPVASRYTDWATPAPPCRICSNYKQSADRVKLLSRLISEASCKLQADCINRGIRRWKGYVGCCVWLKIEILNSIISLNKMHRTSDIVPILDMLLISVIAKLCWQNRIPILSWALAKRIYIYRVCAQFWKELLRYYFKTYKPLGFSSCSEFVVAYHSQTLAWTELTTGTVPAPV
jgi:hypothetical protein